MQIEKLEIKGFGKIEDNSLLLGKGINLVYGLNESGKTTLQWFIKSMLYGLKGGRTSKEGLPPPVKRFRPWTGAQFGGSLEYRLDNGMLLRVERNFDNNYVAVFNENYKNITSSFDYSKETGPLFAEKHLGLNEGYFEKTVLIKQMETRLNEDDRTGLLGKFSNISQTGLEDVSLKDTENNLKAALKNYVGTDRTRTSPVDKLAARLELLSSRRAAAAGSKKRLLDTEAALKEALSKKEELYVIREYMENCGRLLELKKRLTGEKEKEASLQEAYDRVRKAEEAVIAAREEYEGLRLKSGSQGNQGSQGSQGEGSPGSLSRRKNRHTDSLSPAAGLLRLVSVLLLLGGGLSAIYGRIFNPQLYLLAALMLFTGLITLLLSRRRVKAADESGPVSQVSDLETARALEAKLQAIIGLKDELKVLCEKVSAIAGKPAGTAAEARELLAEATAEAGSIELRLEAGIRECAVKYKKQAFDYFDVKRLQAVTAVSGMNLIESSWQRENTILEEKLQDIALKVREYETIIKNDSCENGDLQTIDEEIAELELQKSKLDEKGAAIKLALEVLGEAASELHRDYAPNLNAKMSHFIFRISGGKYSSLKADDKLSLLTVSPETGNVASVPVLSNGTIDQMYLALRLAAAELACSGESLPVILDEPFAQYDDKRTLETLKFIDEYYSDGQVIIFTSKSREVELAEAAASGNINLVRL